MPVNVFEQVRQKVVAPEASARVVGSVGWSRNPVSPVIPFKVMVTTFPTGGTIVTLTAVEPPVGGVIVLAPEARVLISTEPGLEVLEAAVMVSVPTTSPE